MSDSSTRIAAGPFRSIAWFLAANGALLGVVFFFPIIFLMFSGFLHMKTWEFVKKRQIATFIFVNIIICLPVSISAVYLVVRWAELVSKAF